MVAEQVYVFLGTIVIGAFMGVIFDFFRALRRKGNTKNGIVYLQDIVFWLIVAVMIITSSFLLNDGDLRGYMLIGYLLGAFFYLLLFSVYVKGLFSFLLDIAEKGVEFLSRPFQRLKEKLGKKQEILENKQEI